MRRFLYILLALLLCVPCGASGAGRHKRAKVALVLGGGGAKGAATVGVLKEIEKSGVPVDYIVGTSIGSIIGGLYSIGYRADDLDSLFTHQNWLALFNDSKADHTDKLDNIKGFGLMKGRGILQFLDSLVSAKPAYKGQGSYPDSIDFDRLPVPFRAVAFDINSGSVAVLSHGSLPMAMRASMSIPGAFKPVRMDSLLMLDGGVINNLPVDVARAMGADYVIAIDLTQNKHPDFEPKKISKLMSRRVKWLRQRPDIVNYNRNRKDADVYINPNLGKYGVTSFKPKAIAEMIQMGQKAGAKSLGKLRKLRQRVYK